MSSALSYCVLFIWLMESVNEVQLLNITFLVPLLGDATVTVFTTDIVPYIYIYIYIYVTVII